MGDITEHYAQVVVSMPWKDKITDIQEKDRAAAFGFYCAALCYCQDNLTDGLIKSAELVRVFPDRRYTRLVKALLDVRLFDSDERGVVVHDYLDMNKSRAQIESETLKRRDAGRAGGKASAQARAQASAQAKSNPATTTTTTTDKTPPISPPAGGDGKEDDLPKSTRQYLALHRVWERVIGSCPSEAVKRSLRAWGEMQYSEAAVEDALKKALASNARSPASYATAILRDGRKEEPEPVVNVLKGAF